jgi:hypothetical protein
MDNTNPINKIDQNLEDILVNVRKTVLVTNMSLATSMDSPFMATYENQKGICSMAMRTDNTAILAATSTEGSIVFKCDLVITDKGIVERKSVIQCEDSESADEIWELINGRMYDWSQGDIEVVDIE